MLWFQNCIPLKTVTKVEGYKIVEGKPKSKKEFKHYTKFVFSNFNSNKKSIDFLESKFDVFMHKGNAYITHKIFKDLDVNFNLVFRLYQDESRYISLINLLSKNRKNNIYLDYDKDVDEPVQSGDVYKFIEVIIKDDGNTDYLKTDNSLRERCILYLKNLSIEHNNYIENYNFLK